MSSPSMVHRSGDTLVVRSVVSGDALYQDGDTPEEASILDEVDANNGVGNDANNDGDEDELDLPQCKIKRNYTCPSCDYYSQNPRSYLYHLKDVHKQKIRVYECPSCLYASKHSQKLQRHVHMVHVMNKRGKQKMNTKKKPKKAAPMVAILPRQSLLIKSDGGGGGAIAQQHAYTSSSSSIAAAPNQLLSAALSKGDEGAPGGGPGELLTCSICGFATRNVSAMSRHEKLVHLKKRFFRCTKCNYVTHMRARYTKHVKYHSMPMIKCDLCDFRTPYKWNLDRHYKNHQGDGAYKCSLCNFTADIKQSLTVHEMNHHVPPVGQVAGAGTGRRRNKVGASDSMQQGQESDMIDQEEMELLRLERENEEDVDNAGEQIGLQFFHIPVVNSESTVAARQKNNEHTINMRNGRVLENSQKAPKIKISFKKIKVLHLQPQRPSNLTTQPNIKCKLCNFKASWEAELTLHELQVHNVQRRPKVAKKVPRPIPNLIPIQNKSTTSPPPLGSLPILKIPSVRTRTGPTPLKPAVLLDQPADSKMSEKDLNEICAKSCPNSSLRDFASLMGGDTYIEEGSEVAAVKLEPKSDDDAVSPHGSPDPKLSSIILSASTTFKKKNASFFDKLKEKLMVGTGETYNLTCWCGHESKCLSELMRHQKLHNDGLNLGRSLKGGGTILTAGAELSSTRCQHCRQRCKTSSDLFNHLQSCPEASKVLNSSNSAHEGSIEDQLIEKEATPVPQVQPEPEPKEKKEEESQGLHPMENKVFVWNNMPQLQEAECEEECLQQMPPDALPNEEDSLDTSVRSKSPISEGSLIGIETAPGYGAVTSNADTDTLAITPSDKPVKKVFKCPHCTFWASTASRFHVHIVGHLNKKPFECSLCAYRSNWRWDITKHIRLKSARDPNHESAGVLMTDETGRRNYSKYNKYLTMMRVHEPSAESSGSGRRTKGSEATQGTSKLQHPPHLTPPTPSTASATSLRTGPLRPPPPLRAAHHVLFLGPPPLRPKPKKGAVKRVSRGIFDQEGPPPAKRPSVDGKKTTLWKCKKCNFRDARRELVMAHVKEHYQQREMQQMAAAAQSTPPTVAGGETNADGEASVGRGHAPFRCGHCHQVSNWKHVIQRHCRLKHSGDVQVVRGGRSRIVIEESAVEETSEPEQSGGDGTKQCEICPFSSLSSNEMAIHKEHHSSWPGASYKCNFCLYFVSQKKDLVTHLRLHGVSDPEDYLAKNTQSKSPANQSGSDDDTDEMGQQLLPGDSNPTKRYKCVGCPYVSNSKSQFLYHKQFHRPRDAPFKCGLCSYNVSRRHLLHQHLRVHGIVVPPQKSPPKHLGGGGGGYDASDDGADEIEEVTVGSPQSADTRLELDTKAMLDIPLVWVSRGTSFYKMYKCRFCPHVNVRKANIHEHEKMHTVRTKVGAAAGGGGGEGAAVTAVEVKKEPGQVAVATAAVVQQHRCPDCNYVCNNAGVLSSHAKVHQGMYGRVHCLVDATRTDEAQLQDLAGENLVHSDDDGSGVATPPREYASSEDIPEPDLEPQKQQDSVKDYSMKSIMSRPAEVKTDDEKDSRLLYFCSHCPARFLFEKESSIHSRFHEINLAHRCESCSYTARQRPHLLAHHKVHADEYQERTNELVGLHRTSPQHPRPRTAVIVEGPGVVGAVWVVIAGGSGGETHMEHSTSVEVKPRDDTKPAASTPTNRVPGKQYSCGVCPATFFKSVALQYHMTLHGGAGPHHCRFCDYAVKTYGNLVKHEMIHGEHGKSTLKNKVLLPTQSVPLSGTDLFQHRAEVQRNDALMSANNYQLTTYLSSPPPLHIDPQFGILMHGNPDYVYPTYFKNGRLKEKRYKCHKCPSAFEKREQYKVHLTLHGAKQRYRCEKCDYSVKYYANYIQHIRKHQTNDKAMTSRKSETPPKDGDASDQSTDEHAEYEDKAPIQLSFRSAKTICLPSAVQDGPLQLSVADRQSLMLQKLKRTNAAGNSPEPEEPKKVFYCPHCPYSSQRRDGVESHVKRHEAVSGVRGAFVCDHCDYSVPQQHFLREHNKVHFTAAKKQPEAYMKCSRMELWVENQGKENITDDVGTQTEDENANEKVVVFKDHGSIKSDVNRFYPVLSSDVVDLAAEDEEKVYVNILTGEPIGEDVLQAGSPETNELDTLDDTKVVSASDIVDKTDDEMELHQSGSVSSGSSNLCPETGLKLVAEINRSTSSLSSAALDEESKMDVISDCDTNDSENAKDKASVNQNAEDSDGLVN